jgi:DNA-directed RNA polymerase specialized sigma24 family protein
LKAGLAALSTSAGVIRCLVTYSDWWQPRSASILKTGRVRRIRDGRDVFATGLVETLDERMELCRRMLQLTEADRYLLYLWYVKQLPVDDIARATGISRRQCFRRRAGAIDQLVEAPEKKSA